MVERTWERRELPILELAAERELDPPSLRQCADSANLPIDEAGIAVEALIDDGYLRAIDCGDAAGADYQAIELLPRGRREVGQWPRQVPDFGSLLGVLEDRIASTDDVDERSRLEKVRDGLASAGRDIIVSVISEWLKGATGVT